MAHENIPPDDNHFRGVVAGVTDDVNQYRSLLRVDPSTLRLKVDAVISSGGSSGTEYTEDDAAAANPVGKILIARRRDTLISEVTDDGDNVALNATSKGQLHVALNDGTTVTSIVPGTSATSLGKAKGSAVGSTDTGVAAFARLRYSPVHSSGADGTYDLLDLTSWHELRTRDQRALDIQNCNDYTDVTALSNDTTGLADSADHVFGSGAITFNKVNGTDNTAVAGVSATISSTNISEIFEDGAFVGMALKIPSLTDVSYAFIRLGTDASNYNEWQWTDTDMSENVWQILRRATG
ncbi:MAG: hypothetical protein KDA17_07695, partial [Candidatus Saccharibacteria bacterium]|nr:hypothetical protein [Candidatus Saccharibacteria bacterium]